ncbi:hypothetical protein Isop_1437 [Isosphaera pallida ATCC 43644]|uniref:Tetratricopeptide repeat protein n=2 Tax=Isosphaera pallida TaxID=128 RepID=E8QY32_ISOPI|nr:hypothetical protein Isop_1437 [Isosphaera pallida ATCC 43644]
MRRGSQFTRAPFVRGWGKFVFARRPHIVGRPALRLGETRAGLVQGPPTPALALFRWDRGPSLHSSFLVGRAELTPMKNELSSPPHPAPTHLHGIGDPAANTIHHPEIHQTTLERWLRHASQQAWFTPLVVAIVATPLFWVIFSNLSGGSQGREARAWRELTASMVGTPKLSELETVADQTSGTKVELWSQLRLAEAAFNEGLQNLPGNPDAARDGLDQAISAYKRALDLAAPGSAAARAARFGLARSYEARNDLDLAKTEYETLAADMPDSFEGRQARDLAARLDRDDVRAFYNNLYTFSITPELPDALKGDAVSVPPPPAIVPPRVNPFPDDLPANPFQEPLAPDDGPADAAASDTQAGSLLAPLTAPATTTPPATTAPQASSETTENQSPSSNPVPEAATSPPPQS